MNDIKKKGKAEVKNSFYKDLFFLTFMGHRTKRIK